MSAEEEFLDAVRKHHGQWAVHEWRAQPDLLATRVFLYCNARPDERQDLIEGVIGMYEVFDGGPKQWKAKP